MVKLLCPSMMCANVGNLEEEIQALEESGADIFHIDVMDGRFVPNFGMGMQDIQYITKTAGKPVDVHLMIVNPGDYVERFAAIQVDILYIHPEADLQPVRTLQKIMDLGVKPGIAISPGMAVETIAPLLNLAEYVLVMTVNPGFAGQKFIPFVEEKMEKLVQLKRKHPYKIIMDGACSPERIQALSAMGADGFVLGTSALFGKGKAYQQIMPELRKMLKS